MLSQLKHLIHIVDGRYASDTELLFLTDYIQSFELRLQTYLRMQELETTLIQQTYLRMRSINPALFNYGRADLSTKWRQDTIRVLRYTAITILVDDPDTLKEQLLFWFQTVMRAFEAQSTCDVTYQTLQNLVKQYLTPPQAELVCPILELNRQILGQSSSL
ncbi:MAG: allophycocyanin subunit alpha [Elainellaceae cyanobacterium]